MRMQRIAIVTTLIMGAFTTTEIAIAKDTSIGTYSDTLTDQGYTHGVDFGIGLSVGQPVLALDYEYRLSNHFGVGAYGSYSAKKGTSRPGVGALGADFKAHVAIESVDIYLRPGLGVTYFETGSKKVAFLSPLFATGVVIRVAQNFAVGLEHQELFNWTSVDQPAHVEALVAAIQWRF